MKKLFPGLDSAVIIRSPARVRTGKVGPPSWIASFDPPTHPTTLQLFYVTKSVDLRLATYYGGGPEEFIFQLSNQLGAGFGPGLHGGWLFNELVVPHLINVEPF